MDPLTARYHALDLAMRVLENGSTKDPKYFWENTSSFLEYILRGAVPKQLKNEEPPNDKT